MNEIWIPIIGFETTHKVSNTGRAQSKRVILVLNMVRGGYYQAQLWTNKVYPRYIHRLVAIAFIPNPNNYSQINHKDGNKANNHVDNLEWCTQSQNMKHAYDIGLRVRKPKKIIGSTSKPVFSTDMITGIVKEYKSTREASRLLKIGQSGISRCCTDIQAISHGCTWTYKKN